MPVLLPQDAAVPMLQRLGLLGVESLPDLLGEEGKGMELKGIKTVFYKYIHQIINVKHLETQTFIYIIFLCANIRSGRNSNLTRPRHTSCLFYVYS